MDKLEHLKNPTLEDYLDALELPLPWQPSQRDETKGQIVDLWLDSGDENYKIGEVIDDLDSRYILTDNASRNVYNLLYDDDEINKIITDQSESWESQQRTFEQDILDLKPSGSADGLHYRERNAGGGSGVYPIENFEKLLGNETNTALRDVLEQNNSDLAMVRFKDYVVPVAANPSNDRLITAGRAVKLNSNGIKLLEMMLRSSEGSS